MAEDVIIAGFNGVPEWASEKTLADMLTNVEKMADISTEQKKLLEQSLTEMQKTGKVTAQNAKAISSAAGGGGGSGNAVKETNAFKDALSKTTKESLETAAGFDKLPGPLANFSKALKDSSKGFKVALVGLGMIGNVIGKYISTIKESVTVLRSLTESGVQFGGSYLEVSEALADTGLTIEAFGGIAEKYGRVMSQNGLRGLIDLTTAAAGASGSFYKLGLTTAEATEYAAEYLDQQRIGGVFGKAASKGQAEALRENMEMFTSYSKVLNVSRKDMQEAGKEMLGNADLQAELNSMDVESRTKAVAAFQKTSAAFASLGEPGLALGKIFTDIAASPVAEASEGFQQLANAGLGDLAGRMAEVSAQNKSGIALTQEQLLNMVHLTDAEKEQLSALRLAGGSTKETAVLVANLGQAAEEARISQAEMAEKAKAANMSVEDWAKQVDETAAAATHLEDEMNKFQATAEYGMVKSFAALLGGHGTEAVNAMADALAIARGELREFIDAPSEYLQALFDKVVDLFSRHVVQPIMESITEFGDWLISLPGLLWAKIVEAFPVLASDGGETGARVQAQYVQTGNTYASVESGSAYPGATVPTASPESAMSNEPMMEVLNQIALNTSEGAVQTKEVAKAVKKQGTGDPLNP